MPISFSSKSHGRIPIGFFNIETDMLLMDHYFFFSTDFCEWIIEWAEAEDFSRDEKMVYAIVQLSICFSRVNDWRFLFYFSLSDKI